MPFGRMGGAASGLARGVLRSSPLGGVVGAVGGLFGKKPADRNASLRLRKLGKQAMAGDAAARAKIFEMAQRQGSKFATINAAAVRYATLLRANNVPGSNGASATEGAGPIGIMGSGGGTIGAARPRRKAKRRTLRRSSVRRTTRRPARRMSAAQRKYFGKRRRSRR